MNVLLLCSKSPWPSTEGGPIAVSSMIRVLHAAGCEVDVMTVATPKFPVLPEAIPAEFSAAGKFESVPIDVRVKLLPAFFNLFSAGSYNISRFNRPAFHRALKERLLRKNYDIVQAESLYMMPYVNTVRAFSKARVVLRAHNVEHLIWKRMAANARPFLKRWWFGQLARKLENYERSAASLADAIATITKEDATWFCTTATKAGPVHIPFALDMPTAAAAPPVLNRKSFFHLGSMDWFPNIEGIEWFLRECWPDIARKYPGITLHLAGRNMPQWLLQYNHPSVWIDGEVPDAAEYMRSHGIMIVPLLSGSGVRIKILEGMARGVCVISTAIGAEGIPAVNGRDILIASTPDEFSDAVGWCLHDDKRPVAIGSAAAGFVSRNFSTQTVAKELASLYRSVL